MRLVVSIPLKPGENPVEVPRLSRPIPIRPIEGNDRLVQVERIVEISKLRLRLVRMQVVFILDLGPDQALRFDIRCGGARDGFRGVHLGFVGGAGGRLVGCYESSTSCVLRCQLLYEHRETELTMARI